VGTDAAIIRGTSARPGGGSAATLHQATVLRKRFWLQRPYAFMSQQQRLLDFSLRMFVLAAAHKIPGASEYWIIGARPMMTAECVGRTALLFTGAWTTILTAAH
jgi:hypothetical protein